MCAGLHTSGFASRIKYSTVNSSSTLTVGCWFDRTTQRWIHIKFILFSHLFRLCKHRHPKKAAADIRNDGQKESFSVELFIILCFGRWAWTVGMVMMMMKYTRNKNILHYEFKVHFAASIYIFPTFVVRFLLQEKCHMSWKRRAKRRQNVEFII